MTDEKRPDTPAEERAKASNWAQIARYSQAALTLPAAVVAGLLLGAAVDKWLHTTWITIAGLILGAVAGFAEIIRIIMKMSAQPEDDGNQTDGK